ncbi:translation initiation factor 2 [Streptomyces sp. AV19]|uniref:translation initiation factor 2 n=1 Tax=Streptomyces sp. AV19 TaxID=2793068 RepID=UPI00241375F5|nr:translation initiation factor 2 [Streptomyces sp. AV19]MDG4533190.1 translation initiation factor 2 [Streptomyces sp. AV19]
MSSEAARQRGSEAARQRGSEAARQRGSEATRQRGNEATRQRTVLLAFRSAGALHRLLDVLPVFDGDERVRRRFTLVPGSAFGTDALTVLERSDARFVPWDEARRRTHDLVLTASPKGELRALRGPSVLLPHGAGFNKALAHEGSPLLPSGLDPGYLLDDGEPWAALHALAHGSQLDRLAEHCPPAAARATVVGDPTYDRLLGSLEHRDDYRAALGTGERRLVVLTSTWGRESLLTRRPELPAGLVHGLPHDAYQFALVLHPNEHSDIGAFDLGRWLAPATDAGLVRAGPHEEWAALLVACDAVLTDHGSTALYAAALGRPVVGAYDGGTELIPGSPMAEVLARAPRFTGPAGLPEALRAAGARDCRTPARAAFALPGRALARLRAELYRLLDLTPRPGRPGARPLPRPAPRDHRPHAFAVRAEVSGLRVAVERFPAATPVVAHHLAAELPGAGRAAQSAAVLWRRAAPLPRTPHTSAWTAAGWTSRALEDHPGCRTAAALLTPERLLVRHRSAGPLSVRVVPAAVAGRVLRTDPAAALSAVHAWLGTASGAPAAPVTLVCAVGPLSVRVHVGPAEDADLGYEL